MKIQKCTCMYNSFCSIGNLARVIFLNLIPQLWQKPFTVLPSTTCCAYFQSLFGKTQNILNSGVSLLIYIDMNIYMAVMKWIKDTYLLHLLDPCTHLLPWNVSPVGYLFLSVLYCVFSPRQLH
jgi:hypothetical protein